MGAGDVDVSGGHGDAQVGAAGSHGVWTWLEHGTRPHVVQAATGRALRTPYGPRARVQVSGMAAKRTWTSNVGRAVDAAADDARARLARMVG